jgi:ABC-type phosphate/phosphonate transport system substrate-binding protein
VVLKWMTDPAEANPLFIRSDLDKNAVIKLKELVLNMHLNDQGRNALAVLGYRKFVPADSNTYKPLKKFLKEYRASIIDPEQ